MINTKIKIGNDKIVVKNSYIQFGIDDGRYGFVNNTNRTIIKFDKFHCDMRTNDYFVIGNTIINVFETGILKSITLDEYESDFLVDYLNYCIKNVLVK